MSVLLTSNWRTALSISLICGVPLWAACNGSDMAYGSQPPATTGAAGAGTTPAAGTGGAAAGGNAPVAATGGGAGTATVMAGRAAPPATAGSSGAPSAQAGSAAAGSGGMMMAAAGASGIAGAAGMAAAGAGGAGAMPPASPAGDGPTLPMIQGDCPEFRNGTIMVAGHRGITIAAGEAGKKGPVLFYWHGTGSSASEYQRLIPAAVQSEIMSSGGIIASFNGRASGGGEGDCSGTGAHNRADFKAADQIVACAVKNHGTDPRRIYATGCSAGGLQSGCMAHLRSSYMAAVAPNSGGIVGRYQWQDKHSPAVFSMHGGSSDVVIVTFSQTSMSFNTAAKTHGSFVVNCNHNGGHCAAPTDLQASAWEFMKAHPWGTTDSPWKAGLPAGTPSYCKIF